MLGHNDTHGRTAHDVAREEHHEHLLPLLKHADL